MIIRRAACKSNYTNIPNAILQDRSLSYEARGLLGELLSRPPNWEVSSEAIEAESGVGRDKLRRMFRELRKAGYARLIASNDSKTGKLKGRGYTISDLPFDDDAETAETAPSAADDRATEKAAIGVEDQSENRPTENPSFGCADQRENRTSEKPNVGKHGVHREKKEYIKNNIYSQNAGARAHATVAPSVGRSSPPSCSDPQVWVARNSSEGAAWEAHKLKHGQRVPWQELRGRPECGWVFPSRWPPRATNLPVPGVTFAVKAVGDG